jgi:hypothetical protein
MAKRYIFSCALCGRLTEVSRTDAITCGVGCRVRVHRHAELLNATRALAKHLEITVFDVIEARAVQLLRPDLAGRVMAGEIELPAIRSEIAKDFWRLAKSP